MQRVSIVLADGNTYSGIAVAWKKEIISFGENRLASIDPGLIVDVKNDASAGDWRAELEE